MSLRPSKIPRGSVASQKPAAAGSTSRLARAHAACHLLLEDRPIKETLGELATALQGILAAELVVLCVSTPSGALRAVCPASDRAEWSEALRALDLDAAGRTPALAAAGGPVAPPAALAPMGVGSLLVYPLASGKLAGALYLGFRESSAADAASLDILAAHLGMTLERALHAPARAIGAPRAEPGDDALPSEELIAIAVHELRTPLTPLTMLLHVLERKAKSAVADLDTIARTRRQVDRLTQMIADLFDLSRLRRHKLELHPTSSDLGAALEQAVKTFRARNTRLRIDLGEPREKLLVTFDEARLVQSLVALLEHLARIVPTAVALNVAIERRDNVAHIAIQTVAPREIVEAPVLATSGGRVKGIAVHLAEALIERQGGAVRIDGPRHGCAALDAALPLAAECLRDSGEVASQVASDPQVAPRDSEK